MTKGSPGVVILGNETQGLGILRQLAQAGVATMTIDQDSLGVARFSRYCKRFFKSPRYSDETVFVDFLIDLCKKESLQGWTLFPTDDEQVKAISRNLDELSGHYELWLQDWSKLKSIYDKGEFYRFANRNGIRCPATDYADRILDSEGQGIQFPVIVKPVAKENFYREFRQKAIECTNFVELQATLKKAIKVVPPERLLVQERIPGSGDNQYSVAGLFHNGSPVFAFTAQRVRQHPMDFGHASTFVQIIEEPKLLEVALKVISDLEYTGVCEIEYMKHPNTGEYVILEVNPRFWGWHTLSRTLGINLPALLYRLTYEDNIEKIPVRVGKGRWIKTITDLPTAILLILSGKLSPFQLLLQYCARHENASFDLRDPLPFFAEWLMIPYLWLKRGF